MACKGARESPHTYLIASRLIGTHKKRKSGEWREFGGAHQSRPPAARPGVGVSVASARVLQCPLIAQKRQTSRNSQKKGRRKGGRWGLRRQSEERHSGLRLTLGSRRSHSSPATTWARYLHSRTPFLGLQTTLLLSSQIRGFPWPIWNGRMRAGSAMESAVDLDLPAHSPCSRLLSLHRNRTKKSARAPTRTVCDLCSIRKSFPPKNSEVFSGRLSSLIWAGVFSPPSTRRTACQSFGEHAKNYRISGIHTSMCCRRSGARAPL